MGPVFLSFLPFPPSLSILPLNARAMSRVSGSAKVARSKEPQSHCCIRWNTYACSGASHITFGAFLVLDRTGPKIFVQHRKITRKSYRTTDCVLLRSLHLSQVKTHSQKYFLRLAHQSVNTDKGDSGTQSHSACHFSDSLLVSYEQHDQDSGDADDGGNSLSQASIAESRNWRSQAAVGPDRVTNDASQIRHHHLLLKRCPQVPLRNGM